MWSMKSAGQKSLVAPKAGSIEDQDVWDPDDSKSLTLGKLEFCKIPAVQGKVAMLKAWQTFFDAIGSTLNSEPFQRTGLMML